MLSLELAARWVESINCLVVDSAHFSSISRIFLISCSHGWPFVLQHLATSCVVLARLDWQMDYWMEFSRSIQTIPDHSRTKGLEGCVFTTENMPYQSCICRIAHHRGLPGRGGIANVVSFARWRKMGWVTGPRWWVVNPGGWVNLGFLIPNMNMGHDWCPHWTSPNHWVYGQCHGYFFRWCPIFPKWDSYQPQHEVFGWLLSCVFLSYSFPVQFSAAKLHCFCWLCGIFNVGYGGLWNPEGHREFCDLLSVLGVVVPSAMAWQQIYSISFLLSPSLHFLPFSSCFSLFLFLFAFFSLIVLTVTFFFLVILPCL